MKNSTKSHGRLSLKPSKEPRELISKNPELNGVWRAKVITLFPEMFPGGLNHSLVGRALQENLWSLETINLRDFGEGKHKNVDDTPAGGGAGMILRADIVSQAIKKALSDGFEKNPIICLSARGKRFDQKMA